ncbi:MAG: hypothetical protein ACR2M4_01105 [Actinomycetota bacterium]
MEEERLGGGVLAAMIWFQVPSQTQVSPNRLSEGLTCTLGKKAAGVWVAPPKRMFIPVEGSKAIAESVLAKGLGPSFISVHVRDVPSQMRPLGNSAEGSSLPGQVLQRPRLSGIK